MIPTIAYKVEQINVVLYSICVDPFFFHYYYTPVSRLSVLPAYEVSAAYQVSAYPYVSLALFDTAGH